MRRRIVIASDLGEAISCVARHLYSATKDCFVVRRTTRVRSLAALFAMTCFAVALSIAQPASAQGPLTDLKKQVAFEQHPNAQIPLDLVFRDDKGEMVKLGDYFGSKPVILTLNYYHCPNLCSFELDQLGEALATVPFDLGNQYDVVTVSIDPREGTDLAAEKKWEAIRHYARPGLGDGWHFVTGDAAAIQALAQSVGFRYAYDPRTDEFAHPIGLVVLTPQGKIYRYIYGDDFDPTSIRLSLVEASQNKIGSILDQALLICYHYDPSQGTYSSLIITITQAAGIATVLLFGGILVRWWRRDLKRDAGYLRDEQEDKAQE